MRSINREIAACIATLECFYDQIPEMTTHQIQIHLGKSIDQQRQLLALLDTIGEDETAAESQMNKQLEDLRAIQRNLLQKLAFRFNGGPIHGELRVGHGFQVLPFELIQRAAGGQLAGEQGPRD